MTYKYLEKLNFPSDLRKFNISRGNVKFYVKLSSKKGEEWFLFNSYFKLIVKFNEFTEEPTNSHSGSSRHYAAEMEFSKYTLVTIFTINILDFFNTKH